MRPWVAQLPESSGLAGALAAADRGVGHQWGAQPEATGGRGKGRGSFREVERLLGWWKKEERSLGFERI